MSVPGPVDILFDGPPGPVAGRFVEVEKDDKSISIGEWVPRSDGFWVLRLPGEVVAVKELADALVKAEALVESARVLANANAYATNERAFTEALPSIRAALRKAGRLP